MVHENPSRRFQRPARAAASSRVSHAIRATSRPES